MANQLKQRIIGAVVIFGLLIVFLPMIFEDTEDEKRVENLLNSATVLPVTDEVNTKKVAQDDASDIVALDEIINESNDQGSVSNDLLTSDQKEEKTEKEIISKLSSDVVIKEKNYKDNSRDNSRDNSGSQAELKGNEKSTISRAIKYSIDKNHKIAKSSIYAIKVASSDDKNSAEHIKNLLLAKGFPAYLNLDRKKKTYTIYTGPDLELKYIQELAKRIIDETDYQPEIVAHNKDWLTE